MFSMLLYITVNTSLSTMQPTTSSYVESSKNVAELEFLVAGKGDRTGQ